MFDALAEALASALSIWDHKEKTKLQNRLIELRKEHYEEDNKPRGQRNDAAIDRIEHELRVLIDTFAANASISKTSH